MINNENLPSKQNYREVESYLARKWCKINKKESDRELFLEDECSKKFNDIIKKDHKIILLGDGGSGKTTELEQIAAYFAREETTLYPYYINLDIYDDEKIIDLLDDNFCDWTNIPSDKLLIILDGLDEIESKDKSKVIRRVLSFTRYEKYKKAKIIISCRRNFYNGINEEFSGELKGFSCYLLKNLTSNQIQEYLNDKLGIKKRKFNEEIYNNQLSDLLRIPFYLVSLVNLFEENKQLPKNKADVFKDLLDYIMEFDNNKFITKRHLKKNKLKIIRHLEIIAIAMNLLGRNYINNNELEKLIDDESILELIKHSKLLSKRENNSIIWKFEHNNFQEFLSAKCLSEQKFETIKKCISFKADYENINPTWINTLSFLVSILDKNKQPLKEILNWVEDVSPELIVQFETDKVNRKTRIKIFKDIFNNYKRKNIVIDSTKIDYYELAQFGQSREIIKFLLDEIENVETEEVLVTSLLLLRNMKIYDNQKEKTKTILMDKIVDNEIQEDIKSHLINVLKKLNINSQGVVEKVVNIFRTSDNQSIRSSLYNFLYNSNYLDENIDIFLEGMTNIKDKRNDRNSSILIDEGMNLRKGIEKVKTFEGLIKILDYFINNPEDINDIYMEESFEIIAENCVNIYSNELSIINKILKLFLTLVIKHKRKKAKQLIIFFEKTGTRFKVFKEIFEQKDDNKTYLIALALLAEREFFDFLLEQYKEGTISENEIGHFQNILSSKNNELHISFNSFINEQTNNNFKLNPPRDYEREEKDNLRKDIYLLFNKDKFIAEIKKIFDISGKDVLNNYEVFDVKWDLDIYISNLVIRKLRNIGGEEGISLEEIIEKINSWDWDCYCINQIYYYFKNSIRLPLTEEEKNYIEDWCYSNIDKVNFKTALNQDENRSYSSNCTGIYLWFFLRKFNLEYPKNILLDMLSFDYYEGNSFLGIEYLEEYLNHKEVNQRILDNLKNGIDVDIILRNHIDFCKRYLIEEVIPYTINTVLDDKIDDTTRKVALKTICKLSDDSYDLEEILFEVKDEFKWTIIHEVLNFIKKSEIEDNYYYEELKDSLKDRLRDIFKSEDEEIKIKAAQYLIKLGDLESLKYYVEWVNKYGELPKEQRYYDDPRCLLYSEDLEAIPELIKLLELSFKYNFVDDRCNRLYARIKETLIKIALLSEENYNLVKESVSEFISSYSSTYEKVTNLYYFLDNLKEEYILNKSEEVLTIESVIDKMQKWGFINLVFNSQDNPTIIEVKGDNNIIAGRDHIEN